MSQSSSRINLDLSAYTPGSQGFIELEKMLKRDIQSINEVLKLYKDVNGTFYSKNQPKTVYPKIVRYQMANLNRQLGFTANNLEQLYGLKKKWDINLNNNRILAYLIRKYREKQADLQLRRLKRIKRIQAILMWEKKRARQRAAYEKYLAKEDEDFLDRKDAWEADRKRQEAETKKTAYVAVSKKIDRFIGELHHLESKLDKIRDEYEYLTESNPEIFMLIEDALEGVFDQMLEIESLIFENDSADISDKERKKIEDKIDEYSKTNQDMLEAIAQPFESLNELKEKMEFVIENFAEQALHYEIDDIFTQDLEKNVNESLFLKNPLTFSRGLTNIRPEKIEIKSEKEVKEKRRLNR